MSQHYQENLSTVFTFLLPTKEELKPYQGLWVAVDNGRVVGSGKALKTALNRARAKGYTDPVVFQPPLTSCRHHHPQNHSRHPRIEKGVKVALNALDGSREAQVQLLTGLSGQRIEELGGLS
jgi:hypothetical protein